MKRARASHRPERSPRRARPARARPSEAALALAALSGGVFWSCGEMSFVSLGTNRTSVQEAGADAQEARCAGDGFVEGTCFDAGAAPARCAERPAGVTLASACADRRAVACPALGETPLRTLEALLSSLLRECNESTNVLEVRFEDGCATALTLHDNESPNAAAVSDCVARRLGGEAYDCARDVDCASGAVFGVPTSAAGPDWF